MTTHRPGCGNEAVKNCYFCDASMMRLFYPYIFWVFLLSSPAVLFGQDSLWSLERCVKHALIHNIQVRQADLQTQSGQAQYTQSYLRFLPTVDGSLNYNFSFGQTLNPVTNQRIPLNAQTANANLSAGLPLFTGLQQIHNVQKTRYDLLASRFDYETVRQNVSMNVTSAFLQVLLNREIQGIAEVQKRLTEENLARSQALVRSGNLAEVALYDLQAQLARDEAALTNAINNTELSRLSLQLLLQLEPEDPFDLMLDEVMAEAALSQLAEETAEKVYGYAELHQPVLKAAQARYKSALYAKKIALGALFPTLQLFGALSTNYFNKAQEPIGFDTANLSVIYRDVSVQKQLNNNFQKVLGFNLSVPIFQGWQRMTNWQLAELNRKQSELSIEASRNQLRTDVYQAWQNARGAAQSFLANEKSKVAADKALQTMTRRQAAGLANAYEYEQARTNYLTAQSQMIQSKYTYLFRMKVLDFYSGKPLY